MKKIVLIATALLAVLSAAAQQKLNFEAPIQIKADGGASLRYSSDISVTMLPTFSKYGKGLVGLLETCHGISWDEHLFTGLGAGALPAGMGTYAWVKTPVTAHGVSFRLACTLF